MAIQITEQPTNPPHKAYNNSIIEFGVDIGVPVTATITTGTYSFEISADANGKFEFNFKRIVEVLINQDQFTDDIVVTDPAVYLFQDPKLFLDFSFTILVRLEDDTTVTQNYTWPFLKSVEQLIRKPYQNSELKILAPYEGEVCHLSYFEGYPFDIAIYSNIDRSVTVKNLRTGLSLILNLKKGVNRIFISNGENDNLGFESQLPLYLGINELEFSYNAAVAFTLFLDKKPVECGHLLKFLNQEGGWSYFRFLELSTLDTKAATIQRLNADFNNLDKSYENYKISGKKAEQSQELQSGIITEHEKKIVEQIPTSPKVYLYTNEELQPFSLIDFIGIEASNGTYTSANKYRQSNYNISIERPAIYTQTL